MFAASFVAALLGLFVGQVPAWIYMRTGRVALGLTASAVLWVLFDWWLVARYVFAQEVALLRWPAGLLQIVAVGTAGMLAWQHWRRRWSAAAARRTEHFAAGMAQYLRGEYPAARGTFRRLLRTDPWDTAAWIALGDVLAREGRSASARRCHRRARALDVRNQYRDLLDELRLAPRTAAAPRRAASGG